MQIRLTTGVATVALAALQGCAIVGSVPATGGGEGVGYMLPRALLPVTLTFDGAGLELAMAQPLLVGDRAHTYALQRSGNVFTSDHVTITADPKTGLLTSIDAKSQDQSAAALVKLVRGTIKPESADAGGPVQVFSGHFDPGWEDTEINAFNERLNAAAAAFLARQEREKGCAADPKTDVCKAAAVLAADVAAQRLQVAVEGGGGAQRPLADCSAGFCYRLNVPHVVRLSGAGTTSSTVLGLPNQSPTFVMPLERWAFVHTTHDVKLDGGVFTSITTDRPSSAFAVASAPLDVLKGVLSATSEVIQLKVDLSGKEKSLADAKVAEIQADTALKKAVIDATKKPPGDKPKDAGESGLGATRTDAVLLLRVGPPRDFGPTKGKVNPSEAVSTSSGSTSSGSAGSAGSAGRP